MSKSSMPNPLHQITHRSTHTNITNIDSNNNYKLMSKCYQMLSSHVYNSNDMI